MQLLKYVWQTQCRFGIIVSSINTLCVLFCSIRFNVVRRGSLGHLMSSTMVAVTIQSILCSRFLAVARTPAFGHPRPSSHCFPAIFAGQLPIFAMASSTRAADTPATFNVAAPGMTVTQDIQDIPPLGHVQPIAWSILTQRVEDLQGSITAIRDLSIQGHPQAIQAGQELYPRILVISENLAKVGADAAAALRSIQDISAAPAPGVVGQLGQPEAPPPQASGHVGQPGQPEHPQPKVDVFLKRETAYIKATSDM